MADEEPKRPGRKPLGADRGNEPALIRDYPKLLVTIRPSVKADLQHVAAAEGRPMWKIIEDAIGLYIQRRFATTRQRTKVIDQKVKQK